MKKDKTQNTLATVVARMNRNTKTHHQAGYHKPVKNPTTNAAPDSHKKFCKRFWGTTRVSAPRPGSCPLTSAAFRREVTKCTVSGTA